ncbi:MAG TPA: hypothetical protein PLF81_00800 [Candidatus Anammoximicrobium sp.]|nr:hypothetical protein [Candidatus Anammoximicrobium sp.]
MKTQVRLQPAVRKPFARATLPRSAELGCDLQRLEREAREEIDRQRQEQLARLRRLQDQD